MSIGPDLAADRAGVAAPLAELIALRGRTAMFPHYRMSRPAAGGHGVARRGMGMEFAEARPYQPGDDARHIDWRQTARHGRLYTKLFQEEVERPVRLLVDLGRGMRFGTRRVFKSVQAARAAAWLAWAAVAAGDRVGGLVWDGGGLREFHPRGRVHGALALLRGLAEASGTTSPAGDIDLAAALHALAGGPRAGSVTVAISDFVGLDDGIERRIAVLAGRTDLILIHVHDPFEAAPPPGRYRVVHDSQPFREGRDGRLDMTLDLRGEAARAAYSAGFEARRAALERLSGRLALPLVSLSTEDDASVVLTRAFAVRQAAGGGR